MDRPKVEEQPAVRLSDWASLNCSLLWIYDDDVPSYGYNRSVSLQDECLVWLVREGRALVRTEHQEWEVEPGEWFFLPEGNFWQDFAPRTRMLSMRFRATWVTGIPLFHHGGGIKLQAVDYARLEALALPMIRFFKREFPVRRRDLRASLATTGQYLKLQQRLMRWLQEYADVLMELGFEPSCLSHMDPRVSRLARDLDNWPFATPMNEDDLAGRVNLSGRQLARLFQNDFGVTPSRYLAERKLASAKHALEVNEETIKEIAYAHGFKSLSHFSTWFRKETGEPPRKYRQDYEKYHARIKSSPLRG